jgi:hypothetical protein
LNKETHIFRNYTSDKVAMYRDIYKALADGFDELQTDCFTGVSKSDMMMYIMNKTKGSVNPYELEEILSKFEKGK